MKKWSVFFLLLTLYPLNSTEPTSLEVMTANAKNQQEIQKSWRPYFLKWNTFKDPSCCFFQYNVGLGLLYFSGIKGSLSGQPAIEYAPWNATRMDSGFTYNRTPLYEAELGYKFVDWFKLILSYQYQGGVTVQSRNQRSSNPQAPGINVGYAYSMFQANLSINTLLARFTFQLPWALLFRGVSFQPYLGVGIGPSWQSWTRINVQRSYQGSQAAVYFGETQYLRQKISANFAWLADVGLQIQNLCPFYNFFVITGLKYNQYGQARSMGKMDNQGSFKGALIHPVRVKMVYSFAPYLGVKWSFPVAIEKNTQIRNRSPKTWKPFYAHGKDLGFTKGTFAQLNVGPAFFYYSGLRGNLFGRPDTDFGVWGDVELKGALQKNTAPLIEAVWGYQFAPWVRGGLSYQYLTGMTVQTPMLNGDNLNGFSESSDYSQFQANLSLNSILAKAYLDFPWYLVCRGVASNLYLALGGGISWQSWTRMQINRTANDSVGYNADIQPIRQKNCANGHLLIDSGVRMRNLNPKNNFEVSIGCKYNQWGQARNLGDISQQNGMKNGLVDPIKIKMIYTFTPYLAAQWDFQLPLATSSDQQINGKRVMRFKPFFVSSRSVQPKQSASIAWTVGAGFLYFDQIRGNLAGKPDQLFIVYGSVPIKGKMIYSRTPLFEYLLNYRLNHWLQLSLSYQHQGGITFRTQVVPAMNPNIGGILGHYSQFQSNLSFDAIMAKVYFESPHVLISRGISTSSYLAFGVGPGWQTWSRMQVNRMYEASSYVGEPQELNQKISANCTWMADLGLRMQSASPCSHFNVLIGCKYIQWGQARNMGKLSQQTNTGQGLAHPFRIKMVYSFAPYLGMQWSF